MSSVFTSARATFSISTTSTDPATFDASGYAALTYSAVCPIESIGAFGNAYDPVTFDDICTGNRLKIKGVKDSGDMEIVLAIDDTDAGQDYITTASDDTSTADWHFKITFPNKQNATGADAIRYFSGKVMNDVETPGSANDVAKRNVTIAITKPVIKVASTAGA